MNFEKNLTDLRADFPDMPEEVLNEWLKPYVEMLGWPPSKDKCELPQGRWRGILSVKPVAFWARVQWRIEESSLELEDLNAETQRILLCLGEAHYCGKQNEYSGITDGKKRLAKILAYIIAHGCIPSVLVFLEEGSKLSIIDGHHRLVAYFINKDPKQRQAMRQGLSRDLPPFNTTLRKWIGSYSF
jgi:hypothetical protein